MTTVEVFAPAKVNLTLHVTGQRADGYHLLDSLVVFADIGDTIHAAPADQLSLTIEGPYAADLSNTEDNLVLQAARFLNPQAGAALTLTKRLPVASGIGGGSADAAAALRALSQLWDIDMPDSMDTATLGADVPACLASQPCRMQGIGQILTPAPPLPACDILLVNPATKVATAQIFGQLHSRQNAPMTNWPPQAAFFDWLAHQRNDLTTPAIACAPIIQTALAKLRALSPLHCGMSGSGATCYALFPQDGQTAQAKCAQLQATHPTWWCAHGSLI